MRRRLEAARRAKGLTQGQLAKLVGVDQSSISRIEKGIGEIKLSIAEKLIEVLGVTLADLHVEPDAPLAATGTEGR